MPPSLPCPQAELAKLNTRIAEYDDALQADVYRDECALLQKRLDLITEAVDEAEAEASASSSPDEARARLLAKVRADSDKTKALGADLERAADERDRLQRLAADLDGDIAARERGGGQEAKYDELFRRDEEMTQFIDRYPELRKKEFAEQTVRGTRGGVRGGGCAAHHRPPCPARPDASAATPAP